MSGDEEGGGGVMATALKPGQLRGPRSIGYITHYKRVESIL